MRTGGWIQTFTGKAYYPFDPSPVEVDIIDVAHALSNLCRYTGHCRRFYSVAEHSVLVSRLVPAEHARVALLHDATEAYIADLSSPVKRGIADYGHLEEMNWVRAIAPHFDLPAAMPQCVKDADITALYFEKDNLFGQPPVSHAWGPQPVTLDTSGLKVDCQPPAVAFAKFMARYAELA